ncbi:hypothetical protein A4A49_30406 [Nicotiana attenuata]|uniref:Uncharacterized protein n=1 Tax=Nicotiana attenuata TaxID=49451 RepID=A0A1J6ITN0_NICAT|nr:hypothetical protein A4A49_30406 [Nicotiana attenuata]
MRKERESPAMMVCQSTARRGREELQRLGFIRRRVREGILICEKMPFPTKPKKYGHSEEECRKKKVTKPGSPKQGEQVRKEKLEEQKEKQKVDSEEAGNQEKFHHGKTAAMTKGGMEPAESSPRLVRNHNVQSGKPVDRTKGWVTLVNVRKQQFKHNQQVINQNSFHVLDKERNNDQTQSSSVGNEGGQLIPLPGNG